MWTLAQVNPGYIPPVFTPPPPIIPDWAWLGGGWGMIVLAVALALWSIFGDRRRARRRCPRCWYDMAGVGLSCPECGHTARNERALTRRRRRWRWAVLALLLGLVGPQVADQPRRRGELWWTRVMPTTILALTPVSFDSRTYPSRLNLPGWRWVLTSTAYQRPMWSWQRAIRDATALGIHEGDIRRSFETVRWTWTVDDAPSVDFSGQQFLPRSSRTSFSLTIRLLDHPGYESTPASDPYQSDYVVPFALPHRPVGEYLDRFEVTVRNPDGWVIGRWRFDFPTRIVATVEEALPAVDSDEIRQDVAAALKVGWGDWHDFRLYALALNCDTFAVLGGVPLFADVLIDGEPIAAAAVFRYTPWSKHPTTAREFRIPLNIPEDRVTLRLYSDINAAYAQRDALRWWSGTVEVRLTEARARP